MKSKIVLSSSKSLVNRYLILKKGCPELELEWSSAALDVVRLEKSLCDFDKKNTLHIGEGGTSFRFLMVFLSSQAGEWTVICKSSLLRRPQDELFDAVRRLGSDVKQIDETRVFIKSEGWRNKTVNINAEKTTQVLTALMLTAVSQKKELTINLNKEGMNSDYFLMTQNFLKFFGVEVLKKPQGFFVSSQQKLSQPNFKSIEGDWSSAAFLFVLAALNGELEISNLMNPSLQPDSVITQILKKSGVNTLAFNKVAISEKTYKPLDVDLQKSPDLFPVLSVFSCFCEGKSILKGAPQLKYKESDRIQKIYDLLKFCGYKVNKRNDGLEIYGEGRLVREHKAFSFDVSSDHRLFMAAEILISMGYDIHIVGEDSILKSFPEYFNLKKEALKCFF
jgi:3-phosphoshikimate 1-carboxyvinyltransferase